MSEADNQGFSILLPEASVAVYSRHKDTLATTRELEKDWRFARVKIQAEEGDVATAAALYKDHVSPDLVIVQTDTIDDSFTALLEQLAANCDENTAAIVIGPVNDVYLYRRLIDMGVSDYLVRPVEIHILSAIIGKTLIERKGVTGSNLIGFIGAKGGVGVSALSAAAAWATSEILGQKTVLIDGAGGWSTLSVAIGFEPTTTLSSTSRAASSNDEDSLKRMLHKASEKLQVLASGSDAMLGPSISDAQIESIIDTLMVKFPVVIIDLSQATPDIMRAVASRANQIVVVSTPTLPSLRLARTLVHELKDLRGKDAKNIEMIINMQGLAAGNEISKKEIEQAMEFKVSATIPFAAKIFLGSENESKKLIADKDGLAIVKASLVPVLQKLLALDVPQETENKGKSSIFDSVLGKLKVKS